MDTHREQVESGYLPGTQSGTAHAKGEYFSLISADDFFDRRKLEMGVSTLSSLPPNVVLACSERVRVDRHGIPLASAAFGTNDVRFVPSVPARSANIRGSFAQSASTTMRTSVLRTVGGFDERFAFEDRPVQILLAMLPDSRFVFVEGSRTFYPYMEST